MAEPAKYEGASGSGRVQFLSYIPGKLETGDIDVSGIDNYVLSFGFGTQVWWPYNDDEANTQPKVEISVDSGDFYEVFTESDFILVVGQEDLGWGLLNKYEDNFFKMVIYPFTDSDGITPLDSAETINIRISYKAGVNFWIDDLWFSDGIYEGTGVKEKFSNNDDIFTLYPNPTTEFVNMNSEAQRVFIYNINGKLVMQTTNTNVINVSSLPKGIYIIQAQLNNKIQTGKFIKM